MRFGKNRFLNYEKGIEKEWMLANGRSGFSGSTIIGANSRKYHGILIAAIKSPDERYMILPKVEEKFISNEVEYPLTTTKYKEGLVEGFKNLQSFSYDGIPEYKYFIDGTTIKKRVYLQRGKNTAIIKYEIKGNRKGGKLNLMPCMAFRNPGEVAKQENLEFVRDITEKGFRLIPKLNEEIKINIIVKNGKISSKNESITREAFYDVDKSTGDKYLERYYVPGKLTIDIEPYEKKVAYFICTLEKENIDVEKIILNEETRIESLKIRGEDRPITKLLPLAADQFIVDRDSIKSKTILAGYPWFLDWGRDTMIALTGTTMATGRFKDTEQILKSFSIYEKDGIIPNMFPDFGQEPLYNTVDASLWYIYAIYKYILYKNDKRALEFVEKGLYSTIKNIIKAYRTGTKFSISMDSDGLISAGSGKDQVTWMDVRANGIVVTPRHGKAVEINALWYNALKIAEKLGKKFGDEEYKEYKSLAIKVKESFNKKFWNEKEECLYDTLEDASIRPNQIYAIDLPFTMLDREKERKVVNKVYEELYTPFGLRSLSRRDEDYKGQYIGELVDRDMAYHQGTVWGFPLGAFLSSYYKVNDYSKDAKKFVNEALEEVEEHICDACLGGIAEIFDGEAPHYPRGCYNQAWSVGEILRVYVECVEDKIIKLREIEEKIFKI